MDVTRVPADVVFRVFTACQGDPLTLILDVRSHKDFKKKHIAGAYNIRLSGDGRALLDYSKSSYNMNWSKDCWWDKHIVVYGEVKLKRDHPVVAFLAADKHAKSVNVFADGLDEFEAHYPFLVTPSVKEGAKRRYPGEIVPKLLYLGDWDHAINIESLNHLGVKRILTIHNNPDNLKPPSKIKHLKIELADVETEDVSRFFNDSYTFIEEARTAKEGVLVHCGAGVSRSAALCIAYIMRKFTWPAAKARAHCIQRRSVVLPNDGFWRSLCAFESQLGIQQRSDPTAVAGFSGTDAPTKLAEGAAGEKVVVRFVPMHQVRAEEAAKAAASERGDRRSPARKRDCSSSRERRRERSRSGERKRRRSRSRERENGSRVRHEEDRRRGRDEDNFTRRRRREDEADTSNRRDSAESADDAGSPPVILESVKEGKALSRLEIGLKNPHQRCVFGRLPSSEVVLEHLSISRQHAQLTLDAAGDLYITDLGSAHQTNVDGVWIRPNQARLLSKGAVFKLGGSTREFKVLITPRERAKDEARQKAAAEMQAAMAASDLS